MEKKCLEFRDYFLQEDIGIEFNTDQQNHFDTCADCKEYAEKTKSAMDFLRKGKTIDIPGRIEEKLDRRLFKSKAVFRPAFVFSMLLLFLFSSFFIFKDINPLESDLNPHLLTVEMVMVNGKSADIFLDQNDNYINIFIPYKGE